MKQLRFNFCHPVRVHANIVQLRTLRPEKHSIIINSTDNNLLEIPLTGYGEGEWKIMLDWEYEGHIFTVQKEFKIKKAKVKI